MGWIITIVVFVAIIFGARLYFYLKPTGKDNGVPVVEDYDN